MNVRAKDCASCLKVAGQSLKGRRSQLCMSLIDENAIFEPQKMGGDGNGPSMPFFTLLNLVFKGVLTGSMNCCVLARRVQICKQIYKEALPIFYEQNPFIFHWAGSLQFKRFGLEYITDLRINITELTDVLTEADTGGVQSISLKQFKRLRRLTLYFSDESNENRCAETVIRTAANFGEIIDEPKMIVTTIIGDVERPIERLQKVLREKKTMADTVATTNRD